jgi:hypothetical protein
MSKFRTEKPSLFSKIMEYMITIISAACVMYFLFKMVFGTPSQLKAQMEKDSETITQINNNMDTIYALQNLTFETLGAIRNEQNEIKEMVNGNTILIQENNKELAKMKVIVNQKINNSGQNKKTSIKINKPKKSVDTTKTEKWITLDSFFRARQYNN